MATIDKLDISVYNMYAVRTRMIEQINQQFRLEEASSIPPQTQIMDVSVRMTELDILLGVVPLLTPWAYFFPPKQFRRIRRSPFSFSRLAPSIQLTDEGSENYEALFMVSCTTPEEKQEQKILANCFKELSKLNSWLSFIIGRIGQFLQG
jgi:hypothetical protein